MREVPLTDQGEAVTFGETLLAGDCDVLILLTGVGTRMLIATLSTRWPTKEVVAALGGLSSFVVDRSRSRRSKKSAFHPRLRCLSRTLGASFFRSSTGSSRSRANA